MDFFERQDRARRRTGLLLVYFAMAVAGIIGVLHGVFAVLFDVDWRDPELFAWVAGGVLVLVAGGSLVKIAELSRGGRMVAAMLGGEPVSPHTTEPGERRLMNVVEEMAIASGVPVPEVYVLPERGINAFAAGHGPGDTAVGITRGAVDVLTRDELQGVVAHEFSHILHGDMRLNIRLIGLLNGILCLALLGGILLRVSIYTPRGGGGDRRSGGGAFVLLAAGVALYLVGWIGVFFGNLIKAAVSRQREFLADASAVQYTRNPDGIAGALAKIGRYTARIEAPRAAEASHMYFGSGIGDPFFGFFATHPPIAERIAAIAPGFDPASVKRVTPPPVPKPAAASGGTRARGLFGMPVASCAYAAAILDSLPDFSRKAAHETQSACALVYALLLDEDEARRSAQLGALRVPDALRDEVLGIFARRGEIRGAGRIALVDLAIPTLRGLSEPQYREFRENLRLLVESDQQINLFEFVLQKILLRHLDLSFTKSTGTAVRHRSIIPILPEIGTLLTALCLVGHTERKDRRAAFDAGVRELLFKTSSHEMSPGDSCDIAMIDRALDKLAAGSPEVKRRVLNACAQCVAHDGIVRPHEYEILRAIADSVDCPVPPLPHDGQSDEQETGG
jgi:Zn-dependent protease with chaperone function